MPSDNMIHIKCVLLGEANIGKTSIIVRYLYDKFHQFSESTIGCAFNNKIYKKGGSTYKIDIWDTAGQEKYRGLMPMYYRNADIVFICLDLSEHNTKTIIDNYDYWKKQIDLHSDNLNRIIVIVGTKSDNRCISMTEENIRELIQESNYEYFETSAKLNTGINEMFQHNVDNAIDILEAKIAFKELQTGGKNASVNLNSPSSPRFGCCS
jgi:small GTP-binding protein